MEILARNGIKKLKPCIAINSRRNQAIGKAVYIIKERNLKKKNLILKMTDMSMYSFLNKLHLKSFVPSAFSC